MGWVQTQRVLLVWPEHGPRVLSRRLDLLLLHRHAHRLGARLAVVTHDPVLREEAQALGLPVFGSLQQSRRASWRHRVSNPPKRLRPRPDFAKLKPARPPRPTPLWLKIMGGIAQSLVFLAGVAALVTLAWALVPSATLTLTPARHGLQAQVDVIADPQLEPDATVAGPANLIPARALRTEVEDTGLIATTGLKAVPSSPAAGTVVFTNLVGARTVIPQGTGVRTTSGASIRFVTNSAVTVEGRLGAIVEVGVTAEAPGPDGNVAAGQINAIDGPLGLQLAVTNPNATQGGALAQRAAVTTGDRERLRAQLLTQLQAKALSAIQTQLQPGEFLATNAVTVTGVVAEVYNLSVGEQSDTLQLTLRIAVRGLAISEGAARAVAQRALTMQVAADETLLPQYASYDRLPPLTQDAQGRIHFAITATGATVARLDREAIRQAVRGKTLGEALLYLAASQPLDQTPQINVWPAWYVQWSPRLPWLALRINVVVASGS